MIMKYSSVLLLSTAAMLVSDTALAQPNPYGCHYFRQATLRPPTALNEAQRNQIAETIARSDTFDILNYDITLDVTDYGGQRIQAATVVRFRTLQPDLGSILFDLVQLQVDSVIGAEGPYTYGHDGEFLRVFFPEALAEGEEREVTVHYQGTPRRDPQWGGFYFESNYIYNLGIGISTIPPNFGKVWYPCFDSFVERATYTYHVKSAGTFRHHGQGLFLGEVQLQGDTVIRSYSIDQPIPTYCSSVAVADYDVHSYDHDALNGPLPVTICAKPADIASIVGRMVDLPSAIDACEHWYGPYPFDRVGYAMTTDGALENPTNIAYPQFMSGQPDQRNRELLTHELGHMWWGNMLTPYVHNDMWLKEGPAEYSTHLIEEWIGGRPAFEKALKDNLLFILRQAHVNDDGFQPLSPMPDPHIYGTHTYYKGAAVMHNLRGYLGDDLFRQAMLTLQEEYAYSAFTANDFRTMLEAATGVDMDPFFDAWVFAPGYSVFEVRDHSANQSGGQWNVTLELGQKLRGATVMHNEVPLDLTFISATGEVHEQEVVASGELTTLTVDAPFEPAMVVLNRNARLNQARLDHEFHIGPGQSLSSTLPWVDFRAYVDELLDTALVRVEHLWVSPDQAPLGSDIITISNTHYWNVDGLWPEGTVLRGRLFYNGVNDTQLDYDLIAGDETGISVVHRADPTEPWQVYDGQEVTAGSLTNGSGFITLYNLKKGQYAFAKSSAIIGVGEEVLQEPYGIALSPVPTNDRLMVSGYTETVTPLIFDVIGTDGRMHQRSTTSASGAFTHGVDVSPLAPGGYVMRVMSTTGALLGTQRFEVIR
jgi:aminopeptidase N